MLILIQQKSRDPNLFLLKTSARGRDNFHLRAPRFDSRRHLCLVRSARAGPIRLEGTRLFDTCGFLLISDLDIR